MCVMISPALSYPGQFETLPGKLQAIIRIRAGQPGLRVVTAVVIIAVFDKVNIMTEAEKPHDVLEVVPGQPAERAPHDIAEHNNSKAIASFSICRAHSEISSELY